MNKRNASKDWGSRACTTGMLRWLAAVACVASFDTAAVGVGGTPLYDATSGVMPSDAAWGWQFGSVGSFARGMNGAASFLDTTVPMAGQAGYNYYGVGGGLDSDSGFVIDFSLRVLTESHDNNHRAGLSIIVLDNNARGIELGFWSNEIWAQNDSLAAPFTHGKSTTIDTAAELRTYRLSFMSGQYALSSVGMATLNGDLRNYAPIAPFPFDLLVYGQKNYIFIGDNTGSAAAHFELSAVTLNPVPEPAEWALMLSGLGCVVALTRRRRARVNRKMQ